VTAQGQPRPAGCRREWTPPKPLVINALPGPQSWLRSERGACRCLAAGPLAPGAAEPRRAVGRLPRERARTFWSRVSIGSEIPFLRS
jgi:hypothetical protein